MVLGCLMVLTSEGATVVMVEEGEAEYRKGVGVTLLKGSGEGLLAAGAGLWNDLAVGLMKAAGEGEALTGARVELWIMTGAGLDHLMTGGEGGCIGKKTISLKDFYTLERKKRIF